MPKDSVKSSNKPLEIGIECESLEGPGWGVGRLVRKLIGELAGMKHLHGRYKFVLYSKAPLPDDIKSIAGDERFSFRECGLKNILGGWAPDSFSIYYYVLLPIRLWFDRPAAMFWPNYMLPLISPPDVKSLVMLTEDVWYAMRDKNLSWRHRLGYRLFANWAARRASYIMAISKSSRDELMRLFRILPERIFVNELAVDSPRPVPVRSGVDYLLFVGQAFERRHLRESLAAFQELAAEFPQLNFRIIGPDRYSPPLIEPAARLINQRLGRQAVIWNERATDDELAAAMAGAKALIYVSEIEAFGLPPLEALSYGVPAVVATTPLNKEIYGDRAFFADDVSVGSIAAAMRAAITNRKKLRYIESTAETVLRRYTWPAHADRFVRIMNRITT